LAFRDRVKAALIHAMESIKTEIVVVGAGPGGYAAAFYAADLGKKVILVERDKRLGGGRLLESRVHSIESITACGAYDHLGPRIGASRNHIASPSIDPGKLRTWKESILTKLAGGIAQLAKTRGVQVLEGRGYFETQKL